MTAFPDCHHDLSSPMEICKLCFVEILEQGIGNHLQNLIATTIPKDQIDAIQLHSELSHLYWLNLIGVLAHIEEGDLEYEAKYFVDVWKYCYKKHEEYKVFAKKDPVLAFSHLVLCVLQNIENWKLDMNQMYNVDPENELTVKNRNFSERDGTIFGYLTAMYYLNKCAYWTGLVSIYNSSIQFTETKPWDDNKVYYKATMDMIEVLEMTPIWMSMCIRSEYESARRIAFGSLSGWTSTAIHSKFFNKGLVDTGTNESISDTFLKNVIGAAFIACREIEWNYNFQTIQTEMKRHISKSLGMDGPKRPSESTRPATEPWQQRLIEDAPTSRDLEEWQAHERAVRENFDALRRAANLGPREAMVFELLRQEWTEQEIAEELGIKVGTVKSTKSHIWRKIRDCSGDSEVAIDRSDDHSPQIVAYDRNLEHTPCLRCGHFCYRHKWGKRTLHDLGDLSTGHPVDLLVTYSSHYCSRCRKHFNIDLSDVAPPGSRYTHRVIELAVRRVVEDNLSYRLASWHLRRDHRVFVPFTTIKNWVEARGKEGVTADGRGLSGMGA